MSLDFVGLFQTSSPWYCSFSAVPLVTGTSTPVFQRSRIRSKKSGAGASRIRSRSCCRIQDLLIPHFIGSFCLTGAPVKPISSVIQDLLSITTCSNRSTCYKRSTCNCRSNSNTRSFCNNRNAELSCFWFWSFRSFWCGAPVPNYRIWSCFFGPLDRRFKSSKWEMLETIL